MKTVLFITVLLVGCASIPKTIHDVQTVSIPISVKCVSTEPAKPALHSDSEIKAMSDYNAILTLLLDRIAQFNYEAELEAVISACK